MSRTLIRPTAFVDSPFGHDGKVARLAGGMNWFSAVELLAIDGDERVSIELVSIEGLEGRFDDDMARQWNALTSPRAPLQLGERTIRLDQPRVMGIVNTTPDSFSDGGRFTTTDAAVAHALQLEAEGADILDIGGVPAKVRYAGPGKYEVPGVLKIIAIVPDVEPGPQPMVLTIGNNDNSQQPVTVAVGTSQ